MEGDGNRETALDGSVNWKAKITSSFFDNCHFVLLNLAFK